MKKPFPPQTDPAEAVQPPDDYEDVSPFVGQMWAVSSGFEPDEQKRHGAVMRYIQSRQEAGKRVRIDTATLANVFGQTNLTDSIAQARKNGWDVYARSRVVPIEVMDSAKGRELLARARERGENVVADVTEEAVAGRAEAISDLTRRGAKVAISTEAVDALYPGDPDASSRAEAAGHMVYDSTPTSRAVKWIPRTQIEVTGRMPLTGQTITVPGDQTTIPTRIWVVGRTADLTDPDGRMEMFVSKKESERYARSLGTDTITRMYSLDDPVIDRMVWRTGKRADGRNSVSGRISQIAVHDQLLADVQARAEKARIDDEQRDPLARREEIASQIRGDQSGQGAFERAGRDTAAQLYSAGHRVGAFMVETGRMALGLFGLDNPEAIAEDPAYVASGKIWRAIGSIPHWGEALLERTKERPDESKINELAKPLAAINDALMVLPMGHGAVTPVKALMAMELIDTGWETLTNLASGTDRSPDSDWSRRPVSYAFGKLHEGIATVAKKAGIPDDLADQVGGIGVLAAISFGHQALRPAVAQLAEKLGARYPASGAAEFSDVERSLARWALGGEAGNPLGYEVKFSDARKAVEAKLEEIDASTKKARDMAEKAVADLSDAAKKYMGEETDQTKADPKKKDKGLPAEERTTSPEDAVGEAVFRAFPNAEVEHSGGARWTVMGGDGKPALIVDAARDMSTVDTPEYVSSLVESPYAGRMVEIGGEAVTVPRTAEEYAALPDSTRAGLRELFPVAESTAVIDMPGGPVAVATLRDEIVMKPGSDASPLLRHAAIHALNPVTGLGYIPKRVWDAAVRLWARGETDQAKIEERLAYSAQAWGSRSGFLATVRDGVGRLWEAVGGVTGRTLMRQVESGEAFSGRSRLSERLAAAASDMEPLEAAGRAASHAVFRGVSQESVAAEAERAASDVAVEAKRIGRTVARAPEPGLANNSRAAYVVNRQDALFQATRAMVAKNVNNEVDQANVAKLRLIVDTASVATPEVVASATALVEHYRAAGDFGASGEMILRMREMATPAAQTLAQFRNLYTLTEPEGIRLISILADEARRAGVDRVEGPSGRFRPASADELRGGADAVQRLERLRAEIVDLLPVADEATADRIRRFLEVQGDGEDAASHIDTLAEGLRLGSRGDLVTQDDVADMAAVGRRVRDNVAEGPETDPDDAEAASTARRIRAEAAEADELLESPGSASPEEIADARRRKARWDEFSRAQNAPEVTDEQLSGADRTLARARRIWQGKRAAEKIREIDGSMTEAEQNDALRLWRKYLAARAADEKLRLAVRAEGVDEASLDRLVKQGRKLEAADRAVKFLEKNGEPGPETDSIIEKGRRAKAAKSAREFIDRNPLDMTDDQYDQLMDDARRARKWLSAQKEVGDVPELLRDREAMEDLIRYADLAEKAREAADRMLEDPPTMSDADAKRLIKLSDRLERAQRIRDEGGGDPDPFTVEDANETIRLDRIRRRAERARRDNPDLMSGEQWERNLDAIQQAKVRRAADRAREYIENHPDPRTPQEVRDAAKLHRDLREAARPLPEWATGVTEGELRAALRLRRRLMQARKAMGQLQDHIDPVELERIAEAVRRNNRARRLLDELGNQDRFTPAQMREINRRYASSNRLNKLKQDMYAAGYMSSPWHKLLERLLKAIPRDGDTPETTARMREEWTSIRNDLATLTDGRSATRKVLDALYEGWISGLLSSPVTQIRNMSSAANMVIRPATRVLAYGFDQARAAALRLVGKKPTREVFPFGHGTRQLFEVHGFREGLKRALHYWRTESSMMGDSAIMESGRRLPRGNVPGIPGELGKFIRGPLRWSGSVDEFFRAVFEESARWEEAYRRMAAEGKTGQELIDAADALARNPDDLLIRHMDREGRSYTFNDPAGPVGTALANMKRVEYVGPAFGYILPFIRIPINIFKYGVHHSPAGLIFGVVPKLFERFRAIREGKPVEPGRVQIELAKTVVGSSIMYMAGLMAHDDAITAAGPANREDYNRWALTHEPWSIRIGSKWVSYRGVEPIATWFGAMAGFHELVRENKDFVGAVTRYLSANITDKTFLRGASDFAMAYADPERYLTSLLATYAASAIPAVVPWATKTFLDPVQRHRKEEAATIGDLGEIVREYMLERTPGRTALPPKTNAFGEVKPTTTLPAWIQALSPVTVQDAPSPNGLTYRIAESLESSGLGIPMPPNQVTLERGAKPTMLTNSMKNVWKAIFGESMMERYAEQVLADPSLTPEERLKKAGGAIEWSQNRATKAVREKMAPAREPIVVPDYRDAIRRRAKARGDAKAKAE